MKSSEIRQKFIDYFAFQVSIQWLKSVTQCKTV